MGLPTNYFSAVEGLGILRATFDSTQPHQGEKRVLVKPMLVSLGGEKAAEMIRLFRGCLFIERYEHVR